MIASPHSYALAQAAKDFIETAIRVAYDWRADEIVGYECQACGQTGDGHRPGCPVPVLRAWSRTPAHAAPAVPPTRAETIADLAQEIIGTAIVKTFDVHADEIVSEFCEMCETESGHATTCPLPSLGAWLEQA